MSPAAARRQEERRPVTVVFVDVVGSTSVAEILDPEDVLARLDPYYALACDTIERHGGVVEKFIGDAVVGLFGATTAAGLQSAAPIDRVLVADPTYRLCRHRIEFGPAEPVNAKGKAEPVEVWLAV